MYFDRVGMECVAGWNETTSISNQEFVNDAQKVIIVQFIINNKE